MLKQIRKIKAVTFDAGGTILFPYPSVGAVYGKSLQKRGYTFDTEELNRRFSKAFKAAVARPRDRTDETNEIAFWRAVVWETLGHLCPDDCFDEVFEEVFERFASASSWRLAEGTQDLLRQIKARGGKTGLVSNSDRRFRKVFEELGILDLFDTVVLSAEIGFEKPAETVFKLTESRLGVPSHQILHVGDSYRHDVQGAQDAGWNAAWLCRKHIVEIQHPISDNILIIKDITDLPQHLQFID